MMAFIDGENLTMRYQAMLEAGHKPRADNTHIQDIFVWQPKIIAEAVNLAILRVTYYTYAVGDDIQIKDWCDQIRQVRYGFRETRGDWSGTGYIYPRIFKKNKKSAKRKGVDISITVDALGHTFRDSVDIVYLVTGDGDYLPLIEEIMRNGKQVYLAALSNGLNPNLPNSVDKFFNLDKVYFL
jgi:uncharacterized LabA/DUF88 family protein